MIAFRSILATMWIALLVYTAIVISNHGWILFQVFFKDVVAMNWPGQFNFDFMGFLLLSALWTGWRDKFDRRSIALMPIAFFGGIGFLAAYLLLLSFRHETVSSLVLGKHRETA